MKSDRDEDLAREIRAHLELEAEERLKNGLSTEEAARAARRAFGNVTLVQEEARRLWTLPWLEHVVQDVRYAVRRSKRTPASRR
jgi:hypothetical protein